MLTDKDDSASGESILNMDSELQISFGKDRFETKWKNKTITIQEFFDKFKEPVRTKETFAEYMAWPKAKQDERKDAGGYVGGWLKGGKRRNGYLVSRAFISLDLDHCDKDTKSKVESVMADLCCAYILHTTRKHTPEKPRYRLITFPKRIIKVEEYQPVARKLAEKIGINAVDDKSYNPIQLMYWPSVSTDSKYNCKFVDGQPLDVDAVLLEYGQAEDGSMLWHDVALWPMSDKENKIIERTMGKQQNPLEKRNIVGAFCRVYDVHKAIAEFLPEVYKRESQGRYSFVDGTTSNGLAIYGNGLWAYSNHDSDPAGGQLCNAFDLVRIHLFSGEDRGKKDNTPATKLPSFKLMSDKARSIKAVKSELISIKTEDRESIVNDFDNEESAEKKDWQTKLMLDANDNVKPNFPNAVDIIYNDERYDVITRNLFSNRNEYKPEKNREWSNDDTLKIRKQLAREWSIDVSKTNISDACNLVAFRKGYHPVRDYLSSLKWDGKERAETLFIDYLGCDDTPYHREACAKWLLASVTRIWEPGCKWDFVPVLYGAQGIRKSTFCGILAKGWYGELESFDTKFAVEQMAGKWILEIGEMGAANKTELEQQKAFISRERDTVRLAYRPDPETFPRQCVFIATTNDDEFLIDSTGNRRWWPIRCSSEFSIGKEINTDKLAAEVDQIWAEVMEWYADIDADLLLSDEAQAEAAELQARARKEDSLEGIIEAWLETPAKVKRYSSDEFDMFDESIEERKIVCTSEIWADCLKRTGPIEPKYGKRIGRIMSRMSGWKKLKTKQRLGKFGKPHSWVKDNIDCPF